MFNIYGSKLPSYRQAFGYFMFLHRENNHAVRDALRQVVRAVTKLWDKACIPTQLEIRAMAKLQVFFTQWTALKKHSGRTSESHRYKETEFLTQLEDLFDIAHGDAETMIQNPIA